MNYSVRVVDRVLFSFFKMVARSNQVVVEFRSSASGLFHDGFRVTVGHQQRRKTAPAGGGGADGGGGGGSIVAPCRHQLVAGNASSQGHIYSARHWYPQVGVVMVLKHQLECIPLYLYSNQNSHLIS